jgi:hypothetical protein
MRQRAILLLAAACGSWFAATAATCSGHGLPIHVGVAGGRLVVSGGLAFPNGYVEQAFDKHEESFLDTAPGNTLGSILPGFEITGMAVDSQLFLEVVARPDFTRPDETPRWLWFWDEASGAVTTAAGDPTMELASQRLFGSVLLTQFAAPSTGPSVKVAEPRAEDLGTHQHPILYLLDNSPPAAAGVYGFFVRLTSPNYAPSAPFLVAENRTDPANFALGARHINAAARLPGDFDGDDDADGDDFLLWQATIGGTANLAADATLDGRVDAADLAPWRKNFGRVVAPLAVDAAAAAPEPGGVALAAISVLLGGAAARRAGRAGLRRTGPSRPVPAPRRRPCRRAPRCAARR